MINKKNFLGKMPIELGDKDAVHVAIASVRAGHPLMPGMRCKPNELREWVQDDAGPGVVDPFRKGVIERGGWFWVMLDCEEIPRVRHEWEHPSIDFSPPVEGCEPNKYLLRYADALGVTYQQLMDACKEVADTLEPAKYPGSKTAEELDDVLNNVNNDDYYCYDMWSEWSDESGYEFDNIGSMCCPEYDYPECELFEVRE